jgi:hypothetical protein
VIPQLVTKSFFCLLALLLTPLGIAGQQALAGNSAPLDLPNAPSAQGSSDDWSSSQDSTQQTTPPASQTPTGQTTPAQQTPAANQTNQPPSDQPQNQTPEQRRAQAEKELKQEESQRMLGVVPNFNTVISGHAEPLTPGQKFQLFFKSSVDPFQFVAAAADAGLEQAENSYPGYGQGFTGYAKRYGASFTDGFDGNFWGNAVLPSLLHQDPRYFRLGHGTVRHRLLYALSTTVITKGDNGKWEPNYSNIAGNFIGGAISNFYYPASDRGVGTTIDSTLTVTAEGALGSLAVEFYPDVMRHFKNSHQRKLQQRQAAAALRAGTTSSPIAAVTTSPVPQP